MISNETAWNLRAERGLLLPTNREYENPRVAEIAKRQEELMDEMNLLGQLPLPQGEGLGTN
jgi:hypothetical protein